MIVTDLAAWFTTDADETHPDAATSARATESEGVMDEATQALIAGAVYDFAAWLTTRDDTLKLGARHDAAPVPPLIEEWAALRGLDTNNAKVMDWNGGRA